MQGKLIRQNILDLIHSDELVENTNIDECVGPASYELRVGSYYDKRKSEQIYLQKDELIAIPPNGFLLIGTVETVNIPLDIIALMYLRSTYARRGFTSWFQGIVDPGYKGSLTVILHNLTNDLLPIKGQERICHLVFEKLDDTVDKGYEGIYQKSSGATPPKDASMDMVVRIVGYDE